MGKLAYKNIPNLLSLLRLFSVVFIVYGLSNFAYKQTLIIFIVIALSDSIDGCIARTFNCTSKLGSILDPAADKMLLITSFFMLAWINKISFWTFAIFMLRDMFIALGAGLYFYLIGPYKVTVSWLSKINTATQMLAISIILYNMARYSVFTNYAKWTLNIAIITTILSGIDYFYWWKRTITLASSNKIRRI